MLIKIPTEPLGLRKAEHRLKGKLPGGKWLIEHPEDCECRMLHSVKHAPWVSYDQMHGVLACDHCKVTVDLPCPAIKSKVLSRVVKMALDAIEDDIWRFQLIHENCPEPAPPALEPSA